MESNMLKRFGLLAIASLMTVAGYANDEEVKTQDQFFLVQADEEKTEILCCNGIEENEDENDLADLSDDEDKTAEIVACGDCKQ